MEDNWKSIIGLISEIKRCDEMNITTASVAMSFICIDALANLSRPEEKTKVTRCDFKNWVDLYLKSHPDQPYQYRGKDVYAARCAMLHKYGSEADLHQEDPDTIKFGYHNGGRHMYDPAIDKSLVLIGTKSFINDVILGVESFLLACNSNNKLAVLVESRLPAVLQVAPIKQ